MILTPPKCIGCSTKINTFKHCSFARHTAILYLWMQNVPCHQHELRIVLRNAVHIIIIHLTHKNVLKSIGKPCSCVQYIYKSHVFYCKSHQKPYHLLQVIAIVKKSFVWNETHSVNIARWTLCTYQCLCPPSSFQIGLEWKYMRSARVFMVSKGGSKSRRPRRFHRIGYLYYSQSNCFSP